MIADASAAYFATVGRTECLPAGCVASPAIRLANTNTMAGGDSRIVYLVALSYARVQSAPAPRAKIVTPMALRGARHSPERMLASLMLASWNEITTWLRAVDETQACGLTRLNRRHSRGLLIYRCFSFFGIQMLRVVHPLMQHAHDQNS